MRNKVLNLSEIFLLKLTDFKTVLPKKLSKNAVLLYFVLFIAFISRVINLNYNTPYNDEAIYVVIGHLGVMFNDYYSYNAANWMGGLPFLYPTMSALVYQSGGIVASRFLSVIFGVLLVEEIFILTKSLKLFDNKRNVLASFIAALVAGMSGLGIFVSRLATYDIPSFFFLFLGINELIKAGSTKNGRYYFLSAVSLTLSFLIKMVTAVYFPLIVAVSFFVTKRLYPNKVSYWFKYFFVPLSTFVLLYGYIAIQSIYTFSHDQIYNEKDSLYSLLATVFDNLWVLLVLALISLVVLVIKKKLITSGVLLTLALILPATHLILQRHTTLDKHLYLTVLFLAPLVGYGLSYLIHSRPFAVTYILKPLVIVGLLAHTVHAINVSVRLEDNWPNTVNLANYFSSHVEPSDKILSEAGASTILALNDKVVPTNVTTFDWIDYSGFQDINGYRQAVYDKYFRYIQLDGTYVGADRLRNTIYEEMEGKYSLVFKEEGIEIYERQE